MNNEQLVDWMSVCCRDVILWRLSNEQWAIIN